MADQVDTADMVYLSFSGGGYHAQTAGAAWVMGVTDRIDGDVDEMMENVGGISALSGGTWFLTLLAYSPRYLESLEAPDASSTYATPGSGSYFDAVMNQRSFGGLEDVDLYDRQKDILALIRWLNSEDSSSQPEAGWQKFVDEGVYLKGDSTWDLYEELKNETLDGPDSRNAWAASMPLLFTSSLLTEQPALSRPGPLGVNTLTVAYPTMSGFYKNNIPPAAAPMIIAAMGSSSLDAPPLLPGAGNSSDFEATYSVYPSTDSTTTQFAAATDQGGFGILQTGSVSSAAVGNFVDVPVLEQVISALPIGDQLRNLAAVGVAKSLGALAPAYNLSSPMTEITPADLPKTPAELASERVVRLADGGITDKSSVASIMTLLATNDLDDGFNLLFFDNRPGGFMKSTARPTGGDQNTFYTGVNAATLFGFKQIWDSTPGYSREVCPLPGICWEGVSPHIFDNEPNPGDYVYWKTDADGSLAPVKPPVLVETVRGSAECNSKASYLRYEVTTIDNPLFNVKGGKKGTLHVLVARADQKPGIPEKFNCFQPMVDWIHTQVTSTTKGTSAEPTIGDYLEEVLGL
jgi:hypothetical protein